MTKKDIDKIDELDREIDKLESGKEELEQKNRAELEAKKKEAEAIKEKSKVVRFKAEIEGQLIRAISEMVNSPDEGITEDEMINNDYTVLDPANICLIAGKSNRAKRLLARFVDKEGEKKPLPKWEFKEVEGKPASSRYSAEYLMKIFKILEISGESIRISTQNNHPAQIENDDFICILAPRIESEDM